MYAQTPLSILEQHSSSDGRMLDFSLTPSSLSYLGPVTGVKASAAAMKAANAAIDNFIIFDWFRLLYRINRGWKREVVTIMM